MKFVLGSFLIWRIFLLIPLYIGTIFVPVRDGYLFSEINQFLISPWANFDGVHYLTVAASGYSTEANFFPLFPLLIRIFAPLFGYFLSGLMISNISFLLVLMLLYKLILVEYSEKISRQTIIFLLIFPTSFYFASVYSESLFLFLIVSSFYLAKQKKWFLSSIFASLSSATRLTGLIMFPTLIYEHLKREKSRFSLAFLPLFVIPLGIVSYAIFCYYKWGDFLYFIKAHGNFANGRSVDQIILFPQTLFRYLKILTTISISYEWWVSLLELTTFLVVTLLIIVCYKKKMNSSYLVFALLTFLIPASSGTLNGLPRYALTLFPIFIALALIQKRIVKLAYLIISPILLFILLTFFSRGYFVA